MSAAPAATQAHWLTTTDGLRIRVAHLSPDTARGTVLLFPGRTEYIEKYGQIIADFADAGLASIIIDWRGQGLSDRLLADPLSGHVRAFNDYQYDVAALVAHAQELRLPKPWYLLAHSMGGAIGLKALIDGLPVERAAFSAPMWGLPLSTALRPAAWTMSHVASAVGLRHLYSPGTSAVSYPNETNFDENVLTHDRDQYATMAKQTETYPELALGGPSLGWLATSLRALRWMAGRPNPATPTLTILGTSEAIVDPAAIRLRMANWPNGTLLEIDGGHHECLMETPDRREKAISAILDHFTD
ncbi:alpha/beta fold hydrolase [Palleronia sp. THAF1]|uniref:alpha/beta fold hydrolase n=1 Tax=Palleronia sp. THAF1 TaxID=2587842 RepID=UPI0020C753A3|nr:alpha/beta hydrolase [Palleronia sp. THAF1]